MTEYNEGDLIEARKGDFVIRGRLSARINGLRIPENGLSPLNLIEYGYAVKVIERATVKLPTEPGTVIKDSAGTLWVLWKSGYWESEGFRYAAAPLVKRDSFSDGFTIFSKPVSSDA